MTSSSTAVEVKPKRIQRCRSKGWRMPENAVYVGRPTILGNPYTISEFGPLALDLYRNTVQGAWEPHLLLPDLQQLSKAYELHLAWRRRANHILLPELRQLLRGKDLACFCPLDQACHADILLELANQ